MPETRVPSGEAISPSERFMRIKKSPELKKLIEISDARFDLEPFIEKLGLTHQQLQRGIASGTIPRDTLRLSDIQRRLNEVASEFEGFIEQVRRGDTIQPAEVNGWVEYGAIVWHLAERINKGDQTWKELARSFTDAPKELLTD